MMKKSYTYEEYKNKNKGDKMSLFLINDVKNHVEANQWNEALSYIGDSAFRDSKNERFVKALNSLKEGYNIYEGNPQGLLSEKDFEDWVDKLEKIYNLFNDKKNKPEEGLNWQLDEFIKLMKDLKDVKELCDSKKCLVHQLHINENVNQNHLSLKVNELDEKYFKELEVFFNSTEVGQVYEGPIARHDRMMGNLTNSDHEIKKSLRTFTIKSSSKNTFYELGQKYSFEGAVNVATEALNYQAENPKKIKTRPTYHFDASSQDKSKVVKNTIVNLKKLSQQEINENQDTQILLNTILRILDEKDIKKVNEKDIKPEKNSVIFSILPTEKEFKAIKKFVILAFENNDNEQIFKKNGVLKKGDIKGDDLIKAIFDEFPMTPKKAKIQNKTMPVTVRMIFNKYYYKLKYDRRFKEGLFSIVILPELERNSQYYEKKKLESATLEIYHNFIANELGIEGRNLTIDDYEKFFVVYLRKIAIEDIKNNTSIYTSMLRLLYNYLELGYNSYHQLTSETIENIPLVVMGEELQKFKTAYGDTKTLSNYLQQINDLEEHERINFMKKRKEGNIELVPFRYMVRAHVLLVNKYQSFIKGSVSTDRDNSTPAQNFYIENDNNPIINRNYELQTIHYTQENDNGEEFNIIDINQITPKEDESEEKVVAKSFILALEEFIDIAMDPKNPLKLNKNDIHFIKHNDGRILPLNYWHLVYLLEKEYSDLFHNISPNSSSKTPNDKNQLIDTKVNEEFINSSGLFSNMSEKDIKELIKAELLKKHDGNEFKLYEELLKERANKTGSNEATVLENLKKYLAIKQEIDSLRKIENDQKGDNDKVIITPFDELNIIPRVHLALIYLHGVKSSRGDRSSIEYVLKEQKENSNKMNDLFYTSNFHNWLEKGIIEESFLGYTRDEKIGLVFAYKYYSFCYAKSDVIIEFNEKYNLELTEEDIKKCMVAFFAKINK